jgi:tRNA (guanine37-N1)-methyltransferase
MDPGRVAPNGLKVRPRDGEKAKQLLLSLSLLDGDKRVSRAGDHLIFPIRTDAGQNLEEIDLPGSELVFHDFQELKRRPRDIGEALSGLVGEEELSLIGSSYDIIGRILVLELPDEISCRASKIGKRLLDWLPVDTVALKTTPTAGERRVRGLRVVAGSPSLETIHRENGLVFRLDLSKVFFNPRLAGERARIARLRSGSKLVIDMFAGVGSFSITIAKSSIPEDSIAIAIDNNRHAFQYLEENIRLNRAWRVRPILGDSLGEVPKAASKLGKADAIIMNLPKDSVRFLPPAVDALMDNGVLHYYRLLPHDGARKIVEEELAPHGRFQIDNFREAEAYSPSKSIYVADARLIG